MIDKLAADTFFRRTSTAPVVQEAAAALDRVASEHDLSEQQRLSMRKALFDALSSIKRDTASRSPSEAPEEWSKRKGRKEDPISFITRVYAKWLDQGLTRADLLALDQPLYSALGVWLYRHPDVVLPGILAESPPSRGRPPLKRSSPASSRRKTKPKRVM